MNQNSLNRFGKNLLKLFSRKAPASYGCSDIHYLEELCKQSRKISSELDKAIAQQDKAVSAGESTEVTSIQERQ